MSPLAGTRVAEHSDGGGHAAGVFDRTGNAHDGGMTTEEKKKRGKTKHIIISEKVAALALWLVMHTESMCVFGPFLSNKL